MIIGIVALLVFLLLGMPVAFALGASGMLGLLTTQDLQVTLGIFMTAPYRSVASYSLITIPLFVLMAELLNQSGLAKQAYVAAYKWIGQLPGGLAIATILGGAIFGACSGSSTASCATFGAIAVPEMRKYEYDDELSTGTISIAGTLAALIPPSILMVVYGVQTETSIGKLLIAGVLPGLLMTVLYSLAIFLMVKRKPELGPAIPAFPLKERWQSLFSIWPLVVIGGLVLACLYTGITTPTEAAAFGAVGTYIMGLITRTLDIERTIKALKSTVSTTAMCFGLIIGAAIFTYFLTATGATQEFIAAVSSWDVSRWVILLMVIVIYIFLGMFLPSMGTMLLTVPTIGPLLFGLGYDPIWFGVLLVMLLEVGLCTPPVGLNCFVTSGVSGVPLAKVFKGTLPLLIVAILGLLLVIVFPQIIMYFPNMMSQ
ncbi:MAG: TRAP transporter large permease [Syntrophomonadaceae bacterium]|nr:TRAP transporter large permease [Syntrophomonadaceae bacterium]